MEIFNFRRETYVHLYLMNSLLISHALCVHFSFT